MESVEPKKMTILRTLQIMHRYSDVDHPLKQEDIIKLLNDDYGISCERKAVGRNLALLNDAGFEIGSSRDGSYLISRQFEDSELKMLIDAVLSSKYITASHTKEIIEKLCSLSNKYFKSHLKYVYSVNEWSKTENPALFFNIEVISEAIERHKMIKFTYNKYRKDKKLHKSAYHIVSPYQLILHNQRYYVMAYNEQQNNMGNFRIDRITDVEIVEDSTARDLRSIEGYKNGIDYKDLANARPYMFTDKAESVTFLCEWWLIDQVIDWFGYDISIEEDKAINKMRITVRVSLLAMECWAMQYLNNVEVVAPAKLRDKLKQNLTEALKKYN